MFIVKCFYLCYVHKTKNMYFVLGQQQRYTTQTFTEDVTGKLLKDIKITNQVIKLRL